MKPIIVIVLNWNGYADTLLCLKSLLPSLKSGQIKCVVCDNASSDDSWSQILQWAERHLFFPAQKTAQANPLLESFYAQPIPNNDAALTHDFVLLQTGANLGFAGGMNAGLRYARNIYSTDYYCLLNNDVQVQTGAFTALLQCATTETQVGLWGVSLLEADGQHIQSAGGCFYQPWLTRFTPALAGKHKDAILYADMPPLDYISGAALFISKDVINTIGLLNEEYFLYYEELDYCQRLKRAGYAIGWCRSAMMIHKGSATIGANSNNQQQRAFANYYENLSTLKYSRHFHPRSLWLILFNRFVLKSIFIVLRREWYLFSPLWRAYRDFFKTK